MIENIKRLLKVTKENNKLRKQIKKTNLLLRRVYNIIEMSHLNDHKLNMNYVTKFSFPRQLGEDIFNYLQSKDQEFKDIVIKRQKNYRRKRKIRLQKIEEHKLREIRKLLDLLEQGFGSALCNSSTVTVLERFKILIKDFIDKGYSLDEIQEKINKLS